MIRFSREKVLLLHQLLAEETGGAVGLRDQALLDSALESAFAGFGDRARILSPQSVIDQYLALCGPSVRQYE